MSRVARLPHPVRVGQFYDNTSKKLRNLMNYLNIGVNCCLTLHGFSVIDEQAQREGRLCEPVSETATNPVSFPSPA